MIQIIKRRMIGPFLVELCVMTQRRLYGNTLTIHWTFIRLMPGSNIWQMYQKGRRRKDEG